MYAPKVAAGTMRSRWAAMRRRFLAGAGGNAFGALLDMAGIMTDE
jgi:hypothetical protein